MHRQNSNNRNLYNYVTDMSQNVGGTERLASLLAGGALITYGFRRGGLLGTALGVLGGSMLFRGGTGHCHMYGALGVNTARDEVPEGTRNSPYNRSLMSGRVHVRHSVTIDRPVEELYSFWRNFENLPHFMQHLESVRITGGDTSHWKAKAPLGTTVEWDAVVTSDIPHRRIGWKSLENSDIVNSGVVEFQEMGGERTQVNVVLTYEAPGGPIGEWIAKALGEEPQLQVEDDLRRFKSLMEAGSIPITQGQTAGGNLGNSQSGRSA